MAQGRQQNNGSRQRCAQSAAAKASAEPPKAVCAQLEQLNRKLAAASAEILRYQTRLFACERQMAALRQENAQLEAACEQARQEAECAGAHAEQLRQELARHAEAVRPVPVAARTLGILTVGIVTKPFSFEGKRKMGLAEQGIANLLMHVDSLIVIPNERLKMISQEKITLMNAFQAADNVLRQGVESISALINVPAFINLDFADVRSIMKDAGYAHMGVGSAKGAGKAENAAKAAISSPLLETSIAGAHGVIINITSSPDIGLEDVETAAGLITQSAHPDANIIWGTAFDENLSDEMRVTVVATGFDNKSANDLRSSISNAMGGAQSTPSAVFSSEAAAQEPSAAAPAASAAAKPVEEDNSDNGYYDQLMAMLNKRR